MTAAPQVLAVGTNPRNLDLLSRLLEGEGYRTRRAEGLDELDSALLSLGGLRLALVDFGGFDRRVWSRCDALRAQGVPVVLLAPEGAGENVRREGRAHGALDVLVKPMDPRRLVGTVQSALGVGSARAPRVRSDRSPGSAEATL
jgi:DNA-binding response OmpR family regulator